MTHEEFQQQQFEQYTEFVFDSIRRFDNLPLWMFVEAITGNRVLPIVPRPADVLLLEKLSQACIETVSESQSKLIRAEREKDLIFQTEKILESVIEKNNLRIDFEGVIWQADEPTYLEVKVSREQNIEQGSARNFFFQPTANTKIIYSARHLLAGFAVREISEKKWILVNWKLVDLWFLRVKLKPEYNADNLEIYRPEAILVKGDDSKITYRKTV